MPKRFGLSYTDKDGSDKNPVMIHRAILGSFERFMMLLIEHFAGAFPLWLAPEQVRVIPISDKFKGYAQKVAERLQKEGIRVFLDDDSESLGKRIRNGEKLKVPIIMVVGEKEQASESVSIRRHSVGDQGSKPLDQTLGMLLEEISTRAI
jgi:threonyl-tRNA synthetase